MVATSVVTVVAASATGFVAVKLVGAGYLVVLGVRVVRVRRKLSSLIDAAIEPRATRRNIREGFLIGVTTRRDS